MRLPSFTSSNMALTINLAMYELTTRTDGVKDVQILAENWLAGK